MKKLIVLALAAVSLTGCAVYGPYPGYVGYTVVPAYQPAPRQCWNQAVYVNDAWGRPQVSSTVVCR